MRPTRRRKHWISAEVFRQTSSTLLYEEHNNTKLSELFKKLAYSDFSHNECFEWSSSYTKRMSCNLFIRQAVLRPTVDPGLHGHEQR